ncbi:MAG: xanthine dehydrogenase family protein [Thermogemmatispora sp.]|jgi:CO/xanthine dehydrogenase Mo-binding subunit|uniref:Aldehyde dehydrogenase n=1 Tax=Thermogemmatispora aurantia TaxID=2045279 RepID=A0A5J4KAR7_9CHLR|nr:MULTISPECIES: xanthine dehydrogenase family protein molybdopterin-binding subunit [Thermogemmatispora]MBE3567018.1 xanthine dehydrogenase family protein [Thermogemmatispora sp.]GER83751.1 aldehyde dehydrogenase [Thermogemmatispora aurantia]
MTTTVSERAWIGKDLKRREDPALLMGTVTYINDFKIAGMLHAAVLRSPYAHARIRAIDTSAARALPGVQAVLTGKEAAEVIGPVPAFCAEPVVEHAIAVEKVRYAGEAVVAVAAESRAIAEDALDLVEIDWEPLPAVTDALSAMQPGAPLVHENLGTNVVYDHVFTFGDVDGDFAQADHVIRRRLRWPRATAAPLEPNGAVCAYDPARDTMEIWSNTNMLNSASWVMSSMLKIPPHKLNFYPMYTGGSFGSKHFLAKVIGIAGALTKVTGRPVKFMEDRLDNLMANDSQGPERIYDAELAVTKDGQFLSLRLRTIDDYGAYFIFAITGNTNMMAQITGPYTIRSVETGIKAVLTNKNQQTVFRGAGSDVGNWVLERLVDAAAEQLGIDRVEIRRRNFIQPDQFPYKIPTGNVYDSGNYPGVLNLALEHFDLDAWRQEQARARQEGRYLGIGLATAQQRSTYSSTEFWFHNPAPATGLNSTPESVRISVGPTGGVTVTMFSPFWGNSPETVAAQVVAEELGIDPRDVNVTYDSTAHALPSAGPGGSRMTVMLAGAVHGAAARLKEKIFKIAAHMLEASVSDLELVGGQVRVKGVPSSSVSLADIGMRAYWFKLDLPPELESGLEGTFTYDHPYTTKPHDDRKDLGVFYPIMGHAAHLVAVEVDIETGAVLFKKYVAVHDVGTVLNPRSLQGQIRGGIAQGIGLALLEEVRYGPDGQNLTSTFVDYLLPSASDVPAIEVYHQETPSPFTAYGVKGGGEGGRMVAPPAVTSAIEDALRPFGVSIDEMPITPEKIVRWVKEAQSRRQGQSN